MKLILASASPQRKKLLKKLKTSFSIIKSRVKEPDAGRISHDQARALVIRLAVKKAKDVARKFPRENCAVLGADTLVVCKGKILGKPKGESHARRMLSLLSGSRQTVLTGLCVVFNPWGLAETDCAETELLFRRIDPKTIARLAGRNLDKSGAYAIQKMNDRFVREIRGDLDNVIGLPLRNVKKLLSGNVL